MVYTSLYIHVPFCVHRCGYCDFNTYANCQELIPAYVLAVCKELKYLSQSAGEVIPLHTIYFGGGTPSLVPENGLENILSTINNHFYLSPAVEITLEANPGTVSPDYLKNIQTLGVNRISLGMQSANSNELRLLERQHFFVDVIKAIEWARYAQINNLNLDLIFGLPDQTLKDWIVTLEATLDLYPEHLSLYALTLEHGTPMYHKVEKGILPNPDPDLAADMYEMARERLSDAGYDHYEISNWARRNEADELLSSQHNLQYWRNLSYLGVGAGAHGFISHYRTINILSPRAYIKRMINMPVLVKETRFPRTPAATHMNFIDIDNEIGETMMMGLRLVSEGVSNEMFHQRFGTSLQERFGSQIDRLIYYQLLEWIGDQKQCLRLTQKGHLLGNQVFKEFI